MPDALIETGDELTAALLLMLLNQFGVALPNSADYAENQTFINVDAGEIHYHNGSGWVRVQWGTNSLKDGDVTTAKIAARNITSELVALQAIITELVADRAITGTKIADGTLETRNYGAQSITREKLHANLRAGIPVHSADDALAVAFALRGV